MKRLQPVESVESLSSVTYRPPTNTGLTDSQGCRSFGLAAAARSWPKLFALTLHPLLKNAAGICPDRLAVVRPVAVRVFAIGRSGSRRISVWISYWCSAASVLGSAVSARTRLLLICSVAASTLTCTRVETGAHVVHRRTTSIAWHCSGVVCPLPFAFV